MKGQCLYNCSLPSCWSRTEGAVVSLEMKWKRLLDVSRRILMLSCPVVDILLLEGS